jgi:hypothetical protein
MSNSDTVIESHRWRFFRIGGFDQVRVETADDLRHLHELDQKLWAVLACPCSGLEIDGRTLSLIDASHEGRLRVSEVLAAVKWVCDRLADPGIVFDGGADLAVSAIAQVDAEGQRLASAATQLLERLGKSADGRLEVGDFADPARLFPPALLNGDGIVPAALADTPALSGAISMIAGALGGATDRSAETGVDRATLEAFTAHAHAVVAWHAQAQDAAESIMALGKDTASAVAAFDAVRGKVEDHFARCALIAFDAQAAVALNPEASRYGELASAVLSTDHAGMQALPLCQAASGRDLPLRDGLNPAWQSALACFRDQVVAPLLGERESISLSQWQHLARQLEGWRLWQACKPDTPVAALDPAVLQSFLEADLGAQIGALIERDAAADTSAALVDALERLVRLRRDLGTLLHNFVNLVDFYTPDRHAIFQAGTLYLDQRSCELCLRVPDMARHAAMAPLSGTFLVYCLCTRNGEPPFHIVAAMTDGDVDDMMVPGRNGIFYDRAGRDWHASVVKIVTNPISVRQAFWSPYRRAARMAAEQVQKFAAAQEKAVDAKASAGVTQAGQQATNGQSVLAQGFDIARFAGIFAAIGLALGAIGSALAAVISGFLSLPLWKMPLVLVGLMLIVSGPSMLLAWFKLRRRNLGPLLDANGWAVNIRARINVPFGASLTGVPRLPPGATRSMSDPFADRDVPWGPWAAGLAVILLLLWLGSRIE